MKLIVGDVVSFKDTKEKGVIWFWNPHSKNPIVKMEDGNLVEVDPGMLTFVR